MRRRSSPRIKVKDLYAKVKKGRLFSRSKKNRARIIDIGPKGMSIEIEEVVAQETKFFFVIDIPTQHKIKCEGVIKNSRRTKNGYILGIEFTKLSKSDKNFLSNSRNILKLAEADYLDTSTELADRTRLLRNLSKMTIIELAEASGVSAEHISQIENGSESDPAEEDLEKLAKSMGSTREDLVNRPLFLSLFKASEAE